MMNESLLEMIFDTHYTVIYFFWIGRRLGNLLS